MTEAQMAMKAMSTQGPISRVNMLCSGLLCTWRHSCTGLECTVLQVYWNGVFCFKDVLDFECTVVQLYLTVVFCCKAVLDCGVQLYGCI